MGGDDDFGSGLDSAREHHKPVLPSHKSGGQFDTEDEDGMVSKIIKKEANEMFGVFPPRDAYDSKYIMVSLEILRVHLRQ